MTSERKSSERIKVLLIPILGLVLVCVLFSGEDTTPVAAVELADHLVTEPEDNRDLSHTVNSSTATNWPRESMSTILSHNPFELRDPRVLLDTAFYESGITAPEQMTEVTADEFFRHESTEVATTGLFESLFDADRGVEQFSRLRSFLTEKIRHVPTVARLPQISETDRDAARHRDQANQIHQRLLQWQSEPVTMFMKTESGNSALLGGRKVTEGELLEAGVRIRSIDRTGITFETTPGPPTSAHSATDGNQ